MIQYGTEKEESKEPEYEECSEEKEISDELITYYRLSASILRKRDEAITYRAQTGVERRWRESVRLYEGFDENTSGGGLNVVDYASGNYGQGASTDGSRSKVVPNIVRGKCDIAIGRMNMIIHPVDGSPSYDMKPTPVPDLVKGISDERQVINMQTGAAMTKSDGSPMRAKDIARAQMDKATKAMEGMKSEINDQLVECRYDTHARKAVRSGVILGTGVICGPEVVGKYKKKWSKYNDGNDAVRIMEAIQNDVPQARNVDIWGLFPSPDSDENPSESASYIFEASKVVPRDLKKLALSAENEFFFEAIKGVLKEQPMRTKCELENENRGSEYVVKSSVVSRGAAYEMWKYTGEIDKEDLEALGFDCSDFEFMSISATAEFVNDKMIRVALNPIDTGGLNYYFWQWSEVDGSPWGIGIPIIANWQQRVITAAWRAMMDNAGDSAGSIKILSQSLRPQDGDYTLTRNKIMIADKMIDDVRKAFALFQIDSHQGELAAIIDLALKFLDLETSVPSLFQGEKGSAPETFGATAIMIDSNNIAFRTRVKDYDDKITKPLITGFYDWNMQYNENDDIKGDGNVLPLGSTHNFERDQQAQVLSSVFNLKNDPDFAKKIDWDKVITMFFDSRGISVLKSADDVDREEEARKKQAEEQVAQPNPEQQKMDIQMQISQMKIQGEMEREKIRQQSDMAELEFKAQEAERQRQHEKEMKDADLQMARMEYEAKGSLELDKIKADLSKEASKQNLQRELSGSKTTGPQVATPPTEPAGRAGPGQAYQR